MGKKKKKKKGIAGPNAPIMRKAHVHNNETKRYDRKRDKKIKGDDL